MKRVILFAMFVFTIVSFAQTKIQDIINNPGRYEGDVVTVQGTVTKYVQSHSSTNYYILQSDYGWKIKVNTAETAPETFAKYRVKGIVYIDPSTRLPFLSEKSRTKTGSVSSSSSQQQATTQQKSSAPQEEVKEEKDNTMMFIIIGAIVVLVILLIVLMNNKKKSSEKDAYTPPAPSPAPTPSATSDVSGGATVVMPPTQKVQTSSDDFKTIKITTSAAPKTLKFIPGKLVITSGADKGKEFKIAGYPTPEGSVVSIGREEIRGERAHSHIQLLEKTVSRKQAEIISVGGKLYVKNLSETNLTQVDGIEIQPGQKVELKNGSTIRTGEVEFKYTV